MTVMTISNNEQRISQYSITSPTPKVYVLHENDAWNQPLRESFKVLDIPFEEWFINKGQVDLGKPAPPGVFYNRMSASSHTRGHRYAPELTGQVVAWLEQQGRRVINNRRAMQLEVSKYEQYLQLQKHGIPTPRTLAAVGKREVLEAARQLDEYPFILKPNRGGTGAGVQLYHSLKELRQALPDLDPNYSLDGVFLVQQYIEPNNGAIIRNEFIDGKFYYAVRVDTSDGFELCPADACDTVPAQQQTRPKFEILSDYYNPDLPQYETFLEDSGIEIAAIEFAPGKDGKRYVYDVNINTNYNAEAEARHPEPVNGMEAIARFLGRELKKVQSHAYETAT